VRAPAEHVHRPQAAGGRRLLARSRGLLRAAAGKKTRLPGSAAVPHRPWCLRRAAQQGKRKPGLPGVSGGAGSMAIAAPRTGARVGVRRAWHVSPSVLFIFPYLFSLLPFYFGVSARFAFCSIYFSLSVFPGGRERSEAQRARSCSPHEPPVYRRSEAQQLRGRPRVTALLAARSSHCLGALRAAAVCVWAA
jgi:hypothetical protein